MFTDLLRFEWRFLGRKKAILIMLVFYLLLGALISAGANFPFPNTFRNGPYILYYIIGIISLLGIFSTTLLAAQTLFREKDAHFEGILYATPLRKAPYVLSRFVMIFCLSGLCYLLFIFGLMAGHGLLVSREELGPFKLLHYLQPFGLLLLPNLLFCTAVSCSIGLLSGNKMLVYVSGVFIYFLYWGVSFFTNSPLIANSTPVSNEAMRLAALLDPFGMAGFLEQTRYWTAWQRNNQLLQLSGNLLANRLLYLGISAVLLLIAYRKFTFIARLDKPRNKQPRQAGGVTIADYHPVATRFTAFSYDFKCLYNLLKIECLNIIKGIPIWVLCTGWVGFMSIEILSDIGGNTRIPEKFATTDVMIEDILSGLPMVALLVLLFYGNEIYWRSRNTRFDVLEHATPVNPLMQLLSRWLSLAFIIIILLAVSILMGIAIQLLKSHPVIDWKLYASLFYLTGLPLTLSAGLIISIQALIKNRYAGIAIAGLVIILANTPAGNIAGIKHPLLKFANTYQWQYSEMNGFGRNLEAFGYLMLYWSLLTLFIFILANQSRNKSGLSRKRLLSATPTVLLVLFIGTVITGTFIYHRTEIPSKQKINDWKQSFEEQYAFLKNKPQPVVSTVHTDIDLFPARESYRVKGMYTMVNTSQTAIDTLYLYADQEMTWGKWVLDRGKLVKTDTEFGYYLFKMNNPLLPGDSVRLQFDFAYQGSPFMPAASFNTIIKNGSFIRISNYFPRPGYNSDLEIDDTRERKKRDLPVNDHLPPPEAPLPKERGFITFNAVISTEAGQTAIGTGNLEAKWKHQGRNYFHYRSPSPMPFRFAVASANYAVKKAKHGATNLEIYYHPGHNQNIGHLLKTAVQSLEYCGKNFGTYPYPVVRFVEISSFTKGFAGTAYPGNLFINESFGYQNKIDDNPTKDILNEMVSHELSHNWWGNSKIAPAYREGSLLMTETLAMYTELMVYKQAYGERYLADRVNVHKQLYLAARSFIDEEPLYRQHPGKSYLAYDKGMVAMYQLYQLLGEEKVNLALKRFYEKHAYPAPAPVSTDLLNELYVVASPADTAKLDEIFKQIVTYDVLLDVAEVKPNKKGTYDLSIQATIHQYREDGKGGSVPAPFNAAVKVAVYFNEEERKNLLLEAKDGKIKARVTVSKKPAKVVVDPEGYLLNKVEEVKERKVKETAHN